MSPPSRLATIGVEFSEGGTPSSVYLLAKRLGSGAGMRYLGIVIPALALLFWFSLLAIASTRLLGARFPFPVRAIAGALGLLGLLLMAAGLPGAISKHAGYAVPWRKTPYHVSFRGRGYYYQGCDTVRRRPANLVRVGWVYGYFTPWRPLYTTKQAAPSSETAIVLWLGNNPRSCEPVYSLSGGP